MPLKAAIISLGSVSSKWTSKAMKNYFRVVDDINIKDIEVNLGAKNPHVLYQGKLLEEYDCIFIKGSFRYAALSRSITSIINKKAYMPIAAEAFTIVHDKLLTQLSLEQSEIPMPKTYLAATTEAAKKVLENINYPIIMKFPQGTQGKGVMFAESFPTASSMLDALTALKQPFLIQEYVETGGADLRLIVVGDKVVAAMERKAKEGEKRSNIHAGGKGEAVHADAHTKKIAVEAAKAVGAEICGVDILDGPKGPMVIEINISPGLQGITESTGIDIADKIAKHIHAKTKDFSEKKKGTAAKEIMQELSSVGQGKEVITSLDFRGERILLPAYVTKETRFSEKDELLFRIEKGKLNIQKFQVGNEK